MRELMNTHEVAEYLRIKERKVYDLVRRGAIPCSRVTGKWLFPKAAVDLWVMQNQAQREMVQPVQAPAVLAGSHDPLLAWAAAESGCGLALLMEGSLDGVQRLGRRECVACGLHVYAPGNERYNVDILRRVLTSDAWVLIHWAWREQGLILPAGNPGGTAALSDVVEQGLRFMDRQVAAGSRLLLDYLLGQRGYSHSALNTHKETARSETEVALAVQAGKVDAGFGIRAMADQFDLTFIPLHRERYDLALNRRDYFERPLQALLRFAASADFRDKAHELGGYDVSGLGAVVHNA